MKFNIKFTICAFLESCKCGKSKKTRIAHGEVADTDRLPWIVYILVTKTVSGVYAGYGCTGALVDDQHVLTAAHCLPSLPEERNTPDNVRVYLGNDYWGSNKNTLKVSKYYVHESYDFSCEVECQGIDIAVLRLAHPLKDVNAVCLPSNPSSFVGHKALAAGFGEDANGKYPKKLMMTPVTIVSNEQCRDAYQPEYGDLIKR